MLRFHYWLFTIWGFYNDLVRYSEKGKIILHLHSYCNCNFYVIYGLYDVEVIWLSQESRDALARTFMSIIKHANKELLHVCSLCGADNKVFVSRYEYYGDEYLFCKECDEKVNEQEKRL